MDIRSESIRWSLWRKLMGWFVHRTTSILANLNTWCFEHSGDISCSLRVNWNNTDESLEGPNTCLWIDTLSLFIEHSSEHWSEQNIFGSLTTAQVIRQNSRPGALRILVTSVVLYGLTEATSMSPAKDETRLFEYVLWIYLLITLT